MKLETESRTVNLIDDSSSQTGSRHPTILVAEDDIEMRRMLAWSLRRAGYEVIECQDGMLLMTKLGLLGPRRGLQEIDLVVSDIRMPGVTGLQVLERTRDFENVPPMILISAFADQAAFDQAEKLGAATLLPKPFDIDELVAKVRELLPPIDTSTLRRRSPQPREVALPFPLEVTFRHRSGSEPIKEAIDQLALRMIRFGEQILHCHVVIDARSGNWQVRNWHHVKLIISTPGHPIIVEHDTGSGDEDENLYLALHVVFDTAYRQLKQKHQKSRSHIDKKNNTRQ